jgi:hypothetical protein
MGSLAVGAAAAGAIGGAIKGARGTPGQKQTDRTKLAAKTPQQLQQEEMSMQNFQQQNQLANQFERGIGAADQMRDPAIQAYLDQISGKAFQSTPEELANIANLRQAMVQMGTQDVNDFTQRGLTQATSGAAARGLRGQAMGALRGDVINEAQRQVGNISNQANVFAAQQAINNPFQRVQAQQQALNQGLTYGDELRNRAQQNRQQLQNPFLMQQMQNERMATATRTSQTPGQRGGFWGGVTGGLTGLSTGISTGADIGKSYNDINALIKQDRQNQPTGNMQIPGGGMQGYGFNLWGNQ